MLFGKKSIFTQNVLYMQNTFSGFAENKKVSLSDLCSAAYLYAIFLTTLLLVVTTECSLANVLLSLVISGKLHRYKN